MSLGRLFGSLRRADRTHDPKRAWTGAADATPIHGLLERRGVPWRLSREELATRFGLTGDVIVITSRHPFMPGLAQPLSTPAGPDLPRDMPASEFSAVTRFSGAPIEDVRRTAEEIGLYLGRARVAHTSRHATCLWRFGPASLSLESTPDGCAICIRLA
jgi:hypothetical protein